MKKGANGITKQFAIAKEEKISKDDFNEEIDFLGARLNFGFSGGSAGSITKYSNRMLELLADAAMNPLLTEEEFQKEKEKLTEGIKSDAKNVDAIAGRVGGALAYGKQHPYGEFVTEESVEAVTLDDVKTYFEMHFLYLKILNSQLILL